MNITVLQLIIVQCNLDYLDLVYPEPRLSGLARDPQIHYYACAEGVAGDPWGVWRQLNNELDSST